MTSVQPSFVSYALLAHTGLHIPFTSQEDLKKKANFSLSSDYKQYFGSIKFYCMFISFQKYNFGGLVVYCFSNYNKFFSNPAKKVLVLSLEAKCDIYLCFLG